MSAFPTCNAQIETSSFAAPCSGDLIPVFIERLPGMSLKIKWMCVRCRREIQSDDKAN